MSDHLFDVLPVLLSELVNGSPDPSARTSILNRGDAGLLASLDRLSADAASATHGGPSIAAHVDHLRYGLSLLNGWISGSPAPFQNMDWTTSWKKNLVSEAEWTTLRQALRLEATAWIHALRAPREVTDIEAHWITGTLAHIAYHFGAIRQIDRGARGPTAEDEARAEAALRKS